MPSTLGFLVTRGSTRGLIKRSDSTVRQYESNLLVPRLEVVQADFLEFEPRPRLLLRFSDVHQSAVGMKEECEEPAVLNRARWEQDEAIEQLTNYQHERS